MAADMDKILCVNDVGRYRYRLDTRLVWLVHVIACWQGMLHVERRLGLGRILLWVNEYNPG
jgi:hypothetical protein